MKRKAYVIQLRDKDVSAAKKKVDEVISVFEGRINTFYPGELFVDVRKAMTDYDTEHDYVIPVGSTVANFIAGIAVGLKRPKRVKLLVFDLQGRYKEVVLDLEKHYGK